jgi:antitoxin (DNA-binding transcriptional repressor) of toxin-antitoxin stability system
MITVGVRDLKNQLSQYLQYVKDGERVVVTEHDKIIAEMSAPAEKADDSISAIEEKLRQLSMEGEIILAKRNKSRVSLPETREAVDWEAAYNEARADRF